MCCPWARDWDTSCSTYGRCHQLEVSVEIHYFPKHLRSKLHAVRRCGIDTAPTLSLKPRHDLRFAFRRVRASSCIMVAPTRCTPRSFTFRAVRGSGGGIFSNHASDTLGSCGKSYSLSHINYTRREARHGSTEGRHTLVVYFSGSLEVPEEACFQNSKRHSRQL